MAKPTKGAGNSVIGLMMSATAASATQNATSIASGNILRSSIATEGLDEIGQVNRETETTSIVSSFTTNLNKLGSEFGLNVAAESLTEAQKEAYAIVMGAHSDPVAYAQVACESDFAALGRNDFESITAGSADTYEGIAKEYFNDAEVLKKNLHMSAVFNCVASRQNEFGETIFPTITLDPSEAGLVYDVKKTVVHDAVRHALKQEDSRPFNRRNLLDAFTDHTVLDDDAIALVPYFQENGSVDAHFVAADLIAPTMRKVGEYTVRTNPLLFTGATRNLLQMSAHPALVSSGFLDESDDISGRIALKDILVKVQKAGSSTAQVVKFLTAGLPRATFNPSQEGDAMEADLNFRNAKFNLSGATKAIDGSDVEAFEELEAGNYSLAFTTAIRSNINLQTGEETTDRPNTQLVGLYDEVGNEISVTEGAGKVIVEGFTFEVIGGNFEIYRSNLNRRSKGKLIDSVASRERYKVLLGSPLTSRKPIGRTDNTAAIEDLLNAARAKISSQAVTKILDFSAQAAEVVPTIRDEYELVSIEGIGRHYIKPWYEMTEFVPSDRISTTDSANMASTFATTLLTALREQIARAFYETRFQPALEMISGYTMTKPDVILATDPYVAQWLWEKGDVRTLGNQFDYKLVTTNDKRFRNRLQWFFRVSQGENSICPLNFGYHLWVPELITDTNLMRNEGVANEITVQPRNLHIVTCPVTGGFTLDAIKEYIDAKPALNIVKVEDISASTDEGVLSDLA